MTATTRKALALAWTAVPPLLVSALIHAVDPASGGLGGLLHPAALVSVCVWGAPIVGFVYLLLLLAVRRGWRKALLPGALFAGALAVPLAFLLGPGPASLPLMLAGTLLVALLFALAVGPALALGWPEERS